MEKVFGRREFLLCSMSKVILENPRRVSVTNFKLLTHFNMLNVLAISY